MNTTTWQPVSDATHIGEARRTAAEVAAASSLSGDTAGRLAIIVSEAATNLLRHAGEGHLLLRPVTRADPASRACGVEVIAVDSGPGIPNLAKAMRDGYSTAGTMGGGLGAMQRAANAFDIYSVPGKGTVVFALVTEPHAPDDSAAWGSLKVGAVSVPMRGETVCGDQWSVAASKGVVSILIVDGLGHGPSAQQASAAAVNSWRKDPFRPLEQLLQDVDAALRSTRGAAAAAAHIDTARGRVTYAGVGNIVGLITGPGRSQHAVSMNGTLGQQARQIRQFEYAWQDQPVMVMHSDGITSRWQVDAYPGVAARHPAVLAALLHRDANRGRDDATVVVIKGAGA